MSIYWDKSNKTSWMDKEKRRHGIWRLDMWIKDTDGKRRIRKRSKDKKSLELLRQKLNDL